MVGLCIQLIKSVGELISVPLSITFNKSFADGILPQVWKSAHVTPIHKKGAHNIVSNYQPVSLTSVYCKMMESITVNDKSFPVRKLSRFSRIFIKPRKFSLLNFCSSESSDMYEGGDGKNRETFPRIPDEPSKPRNFSPSKLLSFTVVYLICLHNAQCLQAPIMLKIMPA